MDTFRKWWNKPKADDQSLLARFYFADESLTAVASELDSFDGRAEPERCSRLVARLRQGQDQVLSITNVIMDELLADDRTPRAFRAKFPEEVLQESLAGQLWFGAECLAAGSSIMNRELESAAMRPLAKAVTKSLDNVRNLLREQCLRIKTPNAPRLNLDTNDACTETLCESLKIFDRLFAEFELLYVSAMVQVKTKEEHETQEMICVLFSETLQRALRLGRLTQDQVDYFDPALMFSIPRLAIVAGLVIFPRGPLNMSGHTEGLSEMFRPFRTLLVKIRDLLRSLSAAELNQLEQLLCTNEEIGMQSTVTVAAGQSQIEATAEAETMTETTTTVAVISPSNLSNCDEAARNEQRSASDQLVISKHVITDESATSVDCTNTTTNTDGTSDATVAPTHPTNNSINSTTTASTSVETANSTEPNAGPDFDFTAWLDDRLAETASMASMHSSTGGEAAPSGFFLSNTNLGQLLQTVDTPLTDMFGPAADGADDNVNAASDDENSVPSAESAAAASSCSRATDSGIGTAENTSLDRSPDSEVIAAAATESVLSRKYSANWERLKQQQQQQRRSSLNAADGVETTPGTSHHHHHNHHHQHHHHSSSNNRLGRSSSRLSATEKHHATRKSAAASSSSSSSSSSSPSSSPALSASSTTSSASSTAAAAATSHSRKKRSSAKCAPDTSGDDDTSSSQSDSSDTREIQKQLAVRAAGRMKFKSTENLLHRLFVCIAGVADQLQTNFASDLRQILRSVFLMNMSPPEEPPTIEPPPKDADGPATADLFEFRASEQDVVIQRDEREGSNQSIYSAAEEANAEDSSGADSVFGGEEAGGGGGDAGTRRQERSASFEAAAHRQAILRQAANGAAAAMPRTRSLGEEDAASSSSSSSSRTDSSDEGGSSNHNNGVSARPYTPSNELRAAAVAAASVTSAAVQVPRRHGSRGSTAASSLAGSQGSTTGAGSPPDRGRTMATVAATSAPTAVTPSVQPPRWVPDDEAPRCMACAQAFTTFRRRHHCRNCGGVFCGVCSGASAPLPKFGLIKAVRVCRDCFVHEVGA